jgi:hypothetical protein
MMADVVPFEPTARQAYRTQRRAHRQAIRISRAHKFRVEVPITLHDFRADPQFWGAAIDRYVQEFCEDKGAAEVYDRLRVVFVGGLGAAVSRDQAWFTDYISPGMILICFEADV